MGAVAEINLRVVVAVRLAGREAVEIVDRVGLVFPRKAATPEVDWNRRHCVVVDDLCHFDDDVLGATPQNGITEVTLAVSEWNVVGMMDEDLNVFSDHHSKLSRAVLSIAEEFLPKAGESQRRVNCIANSSFGWQRTEALATLEYFAVPRAIF